MNLRPHQARMQEICQEIQAGADVRQIVASITPGGGKSKLPVIVASLLLPTFADRVLWVVPRNSLKWQGEEEFVDPRMPTPRRLRAASGNEPDPARGFDGYITTYQAIGMSPDAHLQFCLTYRTILFLDESHHVGTDATWGEAMGPIRKACCLVIDASGTLSRHDGQKIHGMEYLADGLVNLKDRPGVRVIKYGRGQAMKDGAILPVELKVIDGSAEWVSKEGTRRKVDSLRKAGSDRSDALFSMLRTEYAFQVLGAGLAHWEEYRKEYPAAKVLVVAPDIETAQTYQGFLSNRYLSEIATSDDGPTATKAIQNFKRGAFPILVSVMMAAEGLSVPEITHLICLTQIRSKEWLEQMQARGNRCAPGKKQAWCFAPADLAFLLAWKAIENEALTPLGEDDRFGSGTGGEAGEGFGLKAPGIEPLWSTAHGVDQVEMDYRTPAIAPSVAEGQLRKNIRAFRVVVIDQARPGSGKAKATIWNHTVRSVADKDLDHMSGEELTAVWMLLRERFRGSL